MSAKKPVFYLIDPQNDFCVSGDLSVPQMGSAINAEAGFAVAPEHPPGSEAYIAASYGEFIRRHVGLSDEADTSEPEAPAPRGP